MAEKLLNFKEPLDIPLLENVIHVIYNSTNPDERSMADAVLKKFKEHPDSWTRVDEILSKATKQETKFFALQVLQPVIQYHWKALPRAQCDGIRNFIVDKVIKLSSTEESLREQKVFLQKLNETLVKIIKQEWPRNWSNFIAEIINASKTNESICENNMIVLKMLSEEIFDFSEGKMTAAKTAELKQQFNSEFSMIYQLCEMVLLNSKKPQLLLVSLDALLGFLSWIPIGYVFETQMVQLLIDRFMPEPTFRNLAVSCLTEIAGITIGEQYNRYFIELLKLFVKRVASIIPRNANIADAYERGSSGDKKFIQNLALFFCTFFKEHLKPCEQSDEVRPFVVEAHHYLAKISMVDGEEIFKICLEYWNTFSSDLYHHEFSQVNSMCGDSKVLMFGASSRERLSPRLQLYSPILDDVRVAIVCRMAKPEEVLIVEDENGELIQEEFPDTDEIILYNSMRDTLVYLTHLNPQNTKQIMKEGLNQQVSSADWTWHKLNTICWAIGSISGALSEDEEKRFLVCVIKELLTMCENTGGKDNKAVIASNIMYIVGQYPRFLQAHWKFLCTVLNKLFEFMHEKFPGVREMACETFLKIAKSCQKQFAINRDTDTEPFLAEVISDIPNKTRDLEAAQIQTFYEAVGYMIAANPPEFHKQLVEAFMQLPNAKWREIIHQAGVNIAFLQDQNTAKSIVTILRVNVRVAISLGNAYKYQLGPLFMEVLRIYRAYSEAISTIISKNGPQVAKYSVVRSYRAVKRETLRLVSAFISNTDDRQLLLQEFIPLLLEAVLSDYQTNIPDARDPEVLSLMTAIITKLRGDMMNEIPRIFACVFECTVSMIQSNFEDFPEHRINFFNLLKAINTHCFKAFFIIPPKVFKLAIDSIVWAFKHTIRNIADTGLLILKDLWLNIQNSEAATSFYKTFLLSLLKDIFAVLTDTLHKSGFPLQATILMIIIQSVKNGHVNVPLWDTATANYPSNKEFLHAYIINLIGSAFSNLSAAQVQAFATGLFVHCDDLPAFKSHLRDFLVQMKEFGGDNSELYVEEQEAQQQKIQQERAQIPGLK